MLQKHLPSAPGKPCTSLLSLLTLLLLFPLLAGCEEEQITKYESPKAPPARWSDDDLIHERLLAALVEGPTTAWSFKMQGPDAVVTAQVGNFEQFVRSLSFRDNGTPTWKLPAGWIDKGPSQLRLSTIQVGPAEDDIELAVNMLSREGGDPLQNVLRWRKMLGYSAEDMTLEEVQKCFFEHEMPCGKVIVVDMLSVPRIRVPRHDVASEKEPAAEEAPVNYKLPAGWQRSARPAMMALATLDAGPVEHGAKVTITPLSGAAGGVAGNVNVWRSQVGLESIAPAKAEKLARQVTFDERPAHYFRIDGPADTRTGKQSDTTILGVILPGRKISWFVKLIGPTKVADAEEPAFKKFVESIRIAASLKEPSTTP